MRFEQMQKTKRKHSVEQERSTFPEDLKPRAYGGDGESNIDELLVRIEEVLRALGSATGIEAV